MASRCERDTRSAGYEAKCRKAHAQELPFGLHDEFAADRECGDQSKERAREPQVEAAVDIEREDAADERQVVGGECDARERRREARAPRGCDDGDRDDRGRPGEAKAREDAVRAHRPDERDQRVEEDLVHQRPLDVAERARHVAERQQRHAEDRAAVPCEAAEHRPVERDHDDDGKPEARVDPQKAQPQEIAARPALDRARDDEAGDCKEDEDAELRQLAEVICGLARHLAAVRADVQYRMERDDERGRIQPQALDQVVAVGPGRKRRFIHSHAP